MTLPVPTPLAEAVKFEAAPGSQLLNFVVRDQKRTRLGINTSQIICINPGIGSGLTAEMENVPIPPRLVGATRGTGHPTTPAAINEVGRMKFLPFFDRHRSATHDESSQTIPFFRASHKVCPNAS